MSVIRFENVSKRFGGVQALDSVSFEIGEGEVHAVVGENGAGKSTIMKLLAGAIQPDTGRILLDGEAVRLSSPLEARRRGISIVYQELNLFPHLSVTANIFLNRERTARGFLNRAAMNEAAAEVLKSLGVTGSPRARVAELSIAEKQQVEIARALSQDAQILILDEPNSALTESESGRLFEMIRQLRDRSVTVIYVSHRLEEVFAISDRIAVLRDGRFVGCWETVKTSPVEIVSSMIGRRPMDTSVMDRSTIPDSQPAISVKDLRGRGAFGPLSFDVRPGEILGFAGLEGSGVQTLFRILFGLDRSTDGTVQYAGANRRMSSPSHSIRNGLGLVPANRRDEGLMLDWSIRRNVTLLVLDRLASKLGLFRRREGRRVTEESIRRLHIRTDSVEKAVGRLSGGNQQKVLIARWLAAEPHVLILSDPTRGIDVGAKEEIYALVRELAASGMAILLSSSEIEETLSLSHRVLVFAKGQVVRELPGDAIRKADVLHAMSGQRASKTNSW